MRLILRLIEPGDRRWSFTKQCWFVRVPGSRLWLDLYRATDPQDPPEFLSHERDDVATEIVERPVVDDGPIRIRVRDRRAEWRAKRWASQSPSCCS